MKIDSVDVEVCGFKVIKDTKKFEDACYYIGCGKDGIAEVKDTTNDLFKAGYYEQVISLPTHEVEAVLRTLSDKDLELFVNMFHTITIKCPIRRYENA